MAWQIDLAESRIEFGLRHMMANLKGKFEKFTCEPMLDDAELNQLRMGNPGVELTLKSKFDLVIDTKSVTLNTTCDYRGPDGLDVEKYPEIRFQPTRVKKTKNTEANLIGDLSIKGLKKTIVVPVEFLSTAQADGRHKSVFSTAFVIDRQDYGIRWNRVLDEGGEIFGNDVRIDIRLTFVEK